MEHDQPPILGHGPAPYSTARARATVAVCVVFMALATVAVVARFWSRRVKGMTPALDDWLIVAGLIFYYSSAIQTILQVNMGRLGHHLTDGVTSEQIIVTGKVSGVVTFFAPRATAKLTRQEVGNLRPILLCVDHGFHPMVHLRSAPSNLRHQELPSSQ